MNAQTGVRPTAPDRPPVPRGRLVRDALLAGVALVVLVAALSWLRPPSSVERVTLENPTGYDVDVDVTGPDRDGWTPVGTAESESTEVARQVLDQGDVWLFRFRGQGEDGGELRVPRAELEAAGWRLQMPEAVGERLAAAGASPNP